jgi:hypothetical protein
MIALKPCLEQKSSPSGVLDVTVGYVYDLRKTSNNLLGSR